MRNKPEQIHKFLIKNKKTVAVAESCTGGMVSSLLTSLSGSSKYFTLGVVAYSNNAKKTVLKVPSKLIAEKGAVSKETAKELAISARKLSGADFGVGVTGIAGPTGGTRQKPVGTVFIAINAKKKNICEKFVFDGNRALVRKKASLKALELLILAADQTNKK